MADKSILKAVRKGRLFRVGNKEDAEALDEVLTTDEVKRLKKKKVITGDFKGRKNPKSSDEVNTNPDTNVRPQGAKRETNEQGEVETARSEEGTKATPLPAGFPGRTQLVKAGFDTTEKVSEASDKTLSDIEGVGEATVKSIREALK